MNAPQQRRATTRPATKSRPEVAVADDALSAVLDQWPPEAPPVPKTAGDRARLTLIRQPGTVRLSDWATTDRARANRRARSYTTADPTKLDPDARGTFEARVYHDAAVRKYRIAVRYTPTPPDAPHRRRRRRRREATAVMMSAYLALDPATGDLLVECVLCDHTETFTPALPGDWADIRPAAAAAAAAHTATHTTQPDSSSG